MPLIDKQMVEINFKRIEGSSFFLGMSDGINSTILISDRD